MADIATIASVLSSIKAATDIAKLIKDSKVSLEQAEMKLKLAELVSALADAKLHIANVQDELLEKDRDIKVLKEALAIKKKLTWESPYYWLDDNGQKDGPFCQQCQDNGNKLIRLQSNGNGSWSCRTCNNIYLDKRYTDFDQNTEMEEYDPLSRWRR